MDRRQAQAQAQMRGRPHVLVARSDTPVCRALLRSADQWRCRLVADVLKLRAQSGAFGGSDAKVNEFAVCVRAAKRRAGAHLKLELRLHL